MTTSRSAHPARALRKELGRELRRLRDEAGLTQAALADRVGYHRVSITQLESGRQDASRGFVERLEVVLSAGGRLLAVYERLIASRSHTPPAVPDGDDAADGEHVDRRQLLRGAALGLTAATPGGLPPMTRRRRPRPAHEVAVLQGLRRAMLDTTISPPSNGKACSPSLLLQSLTRDVKLAWKLRQQARYLDLGRLLPGLLICAERAAQELDGDDRAAAHVLYTHVLNAASSVLKKLGDPPLAALAADRSVQAAKATGEAVVVAASAYRLANVFLPALRLLETKEVALSAASLLEPSVDASRTRLAVWGGLVLTASIAAARQHDAAESWELLGEAKAAARRLGSEYADLHTIFGPTSVAIQSVEIAAELGDAREVLRRAQRVDTTRLPEGLLERRSHFLIDVARGHGLQASDAEAVATLLHAERLAPEEVRHNNGAQRLVVDLLGRERRGPTPGLRELATRIGLTT